MNLPTPGRVVLIQTELGNLVPAIVTGSSAGGSVHAVGLSHDWPLTAARAFRDLPHVDTLRLGGAAPAWMWPPRAPAEVSPGLERAGAGLELELEQRAFARSLARFAERLTALEGVAHPPARNTADADDVDAALRRLEGRLAALESGRESLSQRVDELDERIAGLEVIGEMP